MTTYHKIPTVWKRDPKTRHKTLIEGAWSTPEIEYLSGCAWEWTEKIDGTNIRVWHDGEKVRYGGKTDNAQIPVHLLGELQNLFDENKVLKELGQDVVVYGEGYGARIQKGGGNYIPNGCSFVIFDVRIAGWWLKRADVYDVSRKLGVRHVPVLGIGTLYQAIENTARGFRSQLADGRRAAEGLVLRPVFELFTRNGDRIITKVKNNDFAPSVSG